MKRKPKAIIYTLGCRVNTCESLSVADRLCELGYEIISEKSSDIPDAVVINTCAVTAESARKCKQIIRRFRQKYPDVLIAAIGCLCQSKEKLPQADIVMGNCDKNEVADIIAENQGKRLQEQIYLVDDISKQTKCSSAVHSTAYMTKCNIKIEDGCDSKCAYCIIPSLRGRVRSKDPEELMREIEDRVSEGRSEIVLTGIETGSYGKDLKNISLCDILERADKIKGLYLIRLGSLDPFCFNDEFIDRISKLEHLEKHIHLSVQSGADNVLAKMRRKYNRKTLQERIRKLYKAIPDLNITADIIVGFPGETRQDFEETAEFAKEANFFHMHIFPYSEREGTEAAKMPDSVPIEERRARAAELEKINGLCKNKILQNSKGKVYTVHFETKKDDYNRGYTEGFVPVKVKNKENLKGRIMKIRCIDTDESGTGLIGEIYDKEE